MSTDPSTESRPGLSIGALFLGLLVLLALLVAFGFGVGQVELAIWFALVIGWVSFWVVKRRR